MATAKKALSAAKSKLAGIARKKLPLGKGSTVTIRDRLWAVITPGGRLSEHSQGGPRARIYTTRKMAVLYAKDGEFVARLSDLSGEII